MICCFAKRTQSISENRRRCLGDPGGTVNCALRHDGCVQPNSNSRGRVWSRRAEKSYFKISVVMSKISIGSRIALIASRSEIYGRSLRLVLTV